jgi:O-antigen/teichoic acid export membrane protein
VAGVVQFQTANIIIARHFGTSDVTSYNVVYRYFGMILMVFTIFLTPFWSASTEAYLKGDIQWIRNGIKKYNLLNLILFFGSCLMLLFSGAIYRLWLGEGKVNIEFLLSLWGFVFFNISMFGSKYVYFLNSINALKIQFWACILSPFIYIVVSLILINYYHLGIYSLFIASVVANFNSYFLAPLQYNQVINKNKKGIWVK